MALRLLLDEHVPPIVSEQLTRKYPALVVVSMQEWRDGAFLGAADLEILRAAHVERLTLVTYDMATILTLVEEFGQRGESFSGLVFVDSRTVRQSDIGGLVRGLARLWELEGDLEWEDRLRFLDRE